MRQRKYQTYSVALLLFLCLTVQACRDNQLKVLAKTCRSVQIACEEVFKDAVQMRQEGILTQEETNQVILVARKVLVASDQANQMIEPLATLDPNSKVKVLDLLKPVLAALDSGLQEGVFGIKNSLAKERVNIALTAIRASLNVAVQLLS
jgi:hypothetical protein